MASPRRSDSHTVYGDPGIDPSIPQYDPNAPKPAPYKSPETIGQSIRAGAYNVIDAAKSFPGEVRGAMRQVIDNPAEAIPDGLARFTAPMVGGSSIFSGANKIAQAYNNTRKAAEITRQVSPGAAAVARNALPSYGQAALGTVGATSTAVGVAAVDRAQTEAAAPNAGFRRLDDGTLEYPTTAQTYAFGRPADRKLDDGTPVFASEAKLDTDKMRGLARRSAADFQYAPADGNVQATPNFANQLTRRGNQGAVIKNPHGMSLEDRMRGLLTSMKGSPSMRKAAAEAMLAEQQNDYGSHQAALNRNDAAESDMMNAQAKANESYADRRLKADSFNQDIGLRRHALAQKQAQNDAENTLKAYELTMGGLTRRGGKTEEDPDTKFYDSVYKSALEATDDPRAAAAYASRVMTDGGNDPGGTAAGRVGLTSERDAFANAREAYNSRWTTSSTPDFDTSTANLTKRNWFERQISRLPGGKDPTDLKWVDANGNEDWTGREAIGDEAPETYAQRRARNLELQRRSKGTN